MCLKHSARARQIRQIAIEEFAPFFLVKVAVSIFVLLQVSKMKRL
jgi:hypothetical protein